VGQVAEGGAGEAEGAQGAAHVRFRRRVEQTGRVQVPAVAGHVRGHVERVQRLHSDSTGGQLQRHPPRQVVHVGLSEACATTTE